MKNSKSHRVLGLELSGAKNQKTSLAILEFFPKEQKIFLLDVFEGLGSDENRSGDEALLHLLLEKRTRLTTLGVNVPCSLPPCLGCTKKSCSTAPRCSSPDVRWMIQFTKKIERRGNLKVLEFTPYTQRPVELWIRYEVFSQLNEKFEFELDETMGGNRAPLTARMLYLKHHLKGWPIIETLPKLSIATLAESLKLPPRTVTGYRQLERGEALRRQILEEICKHFKVFIYERDSRRLSKNLGAFDAFVCGLTTLLAITDRCQKPPKDFPVSSGWISYPTL